MVIISETDFLYLIFFSCSGFLFDFLFNLNCSNKDIGLEKNVFQKTLTETITEFVRRIFKWNLANTFSFQREIVWKFVEVVAKFEISCRWQAEAAEAEYGVRLTDCFVKVCWNSNSTMMMMMI